MSSSMTAPMLSQSALPVELPGQTLLAMAFQLSSPNALLVLLTTVARLGCQLHRVEAAGCEATLEVLAPSHLAHRVLPLLDQLIDVQHARFQVG